jgi:hypothetical protein
MHVRSQHQDRYRAAVVQGATWRHLPAGCACSAQLRGCWCLCPPGHPTAHFTNAWPARRYVDGCWINFSQPVSGKHVGGEHAATAAQVRLLHVVWGMTHTCTLLHYMSKSTLEDRACCKRPELWTNTAGVSCCMCNALHAELRCSNTSTRLYKLVFSIAVLGSAAAQHVLLSSSPAQQ